MITYSYGALTPTRGLGTLLDQLRLAHRYRNRLIEIELYRRAARDLGVDADEIKTAVKAETRAARKASGLGWGTYQLIEDDVQRASKTATPRFRKFDGTGRVGAPIQACTGADEKLGHGVELSKPDERGHARIRIRLVRDEWIEMPVKIHRPLPTGQVVRVAVVVDRIGTRYVYGIRIVSKSTRERRLGDGRVAINFGWRRVEGGVRVATAVGDHGAHELVIPDAIIGAYYHSEKLRSIADSEAHAYLGDSRKRRRCREAGLRHPAPQVPAERHGPWANSRHWALQDRHLYQWERDEYRKSGRRRDAVVLDWVQGLAKLYDRVAVETFSMDALIRRESDEAVNIPEARHIRFLVAPGRVRQTCAQVFGDRLEKLPRKKRTTVCADCGGELTGDRACKIKLHCERCGGERDQDLNNATNQLSEMAAE